MEILDFLFIAKSVKETEVIKIFVRTSYVRCIVDKGFSQLKAIMDYST